MSVRNWSDSVDLSRRRGKFSYLLAALIGLVVVYPFFQTGSLRREVLALLALAIPAAGIYAVSEDRRRLILSLALGIPSLIGGLEALAGIELLPGRVLALALALAFYVYAAGSITAHVLKAEDVTLDTLFGAASIYLLLGFVWTLGYMLLERLQPGSFSFASGSTSMGAPTLADFVYYSFVTLTTLGYGDIAPVTARARSLAVLEAIIGVLFVALLIARLVGMYRRPEPTGR